MARFVNILVILATIYAAKCFIHFDGHHYYDAVHSWKLINLLWHSFFHAQQELKYIFSNYTLKTKQNLNDEITEWIKNQSKILENAITENLNNFMHQINQTRMSIEQAPNISIETGEALLNLLTIKANMSLTKIEENDEIKQIMKTLNRKQEQEQQQQQQQRIRRRAWDSYEYLDCDDEIHPNITDIIELYYYS
uniref:SXP/RAL-2 family protein Ani s 5-like cation-binding domain-containing protein n=1 Tax=Onchocerca volvulus TaxID=6282 RepID=A0A8R1XTD2_ONCVO